MNTNKIKVVCLAILLSIFTTIVLADTSNQSNVENMTTPNMTTPTGTESGFVFSENVTVSLTNTENIQVNNFVVNIGIDKPIIIDAVQVSKNEKRVRIKDPDTDEVIVVIVGPQGQTTEAKQNIESFTQTVNNFIGRHVTFKLIGNKITDYTVEGKLIFRSIDLGFVPKNIKRVGSQLKVFDSNDHMVIIHDNDEGIITEKSSDKIQAVYNIASGINVNGNSKRVDLSNDIKASILGDDQTKISTTGNIVTVMLTEDGKSTFIAKHVKSDVFEDRIVEGIASNQIGGVITIDSADSHDITTFNVDTSILKVVTNTVSVSVNSPTSEGKIIALNVNKDILKDLNLRVLVDGKEIQKAVDLDDLFKNDKFSSLIVIGQNIQILISIPKFSEHQITITSEAAPLSTSTPYSTSTVAESPAITETPIASMTTTAPSTPGFTVGLMLAAITILYILMRK